jgi:hypothetical protein
VRVVPHEELEDTRPLEQQDLLAAERNCAPDDARAALGTIVEAIRSRSDQKPYVYQVAGNQLKSLPPELGLLTNLKWLYVR